MPQDHRSTENRLRNTEGAIEAIKRGYQPVPLVTGSRSPRIAGWSKLRWENTPEGIEEARKKFDDWSEIGHGGLGVLLGKPSEGLIDIDLDHPKTARLRDHFLPPTPARSGRDSRPNTHYWYIAKPDTLQESRTFKLPPSEAAGDQMIVEYRSTGGQTALPGNIHDSGEKYNWSGQPWGGSAGPTEVDGRMLLVQVALLGFCTLLVNYWPGPGARHETYLALAGGLLRVGDGVHPYWERNIGVVISAIADATHDEDGAETRVHEAVETTLTRLREGKPASGFGKLAEILGDDVVKQARVLLAEVESAAGLPSRTSGTLSLEKLGAAVTGTTSDETTATQPSTPASHSERLQRTGEVLDGDHPDSLPNIKRDPLEERQGTWEALDLDPYLTGQVQTVDPTVLEREDGQALMYPGRLNMLYGPSESAKSWISMFTCIQLIERGERVLYLDFEDEPVNALDRMKLLGASYDDLRTSFRYVRPEEPLATMQRTRWGEAKQTEQGLLNERLFLNLLDEHDPALIVADGMTVLYGLHGLDSNDSVQTDIITTWLKTLTRNGRTTVIIVDHTAKNPTRGSLPIGSQHKVSMVQGSLLQCYPVSQPMPGAKGEVELIVLKDRPGKVRAASQKSGERAQLAGRLFMDSTVPGETKVTLTSPERAKPKDDPDKPSQQEVDLRHQRAAERAEQVERENFQVLDLFGGEVGAALSMSEMVELVHGIPDAKDATTKQKNEVKRGVARLMQEGWLSKQGTTKGSLYVLDVSMVEDNE